MRVSFHLSCRHGRHHSTLAKERCWNGKMKHDVDAVKDQTKHMVQNLAWLAMFHSTSLGLSSNDTMIDCFSVLASRDNS
jgi:hypothetical protein